MSNILHHLLSFLTPVQQGALPELSRRGTSSSGLRRGSVAALGRRRGITGASAAAVCLLRTGGFGRTGRLSLPGPRRRERMAPLRREDRGLDSPSGLGRPGGCGQERQDGYRESTSPRRELRLLVVYVEAPVSLQAQLHDNPLEFAPL